MIVHSKPWIVEADLSAVADILRSNMIAQGDKTKEFESAVSGWVGAAGGVGVASGSAGIALALMALEIGRGHEVVLPSYVCPSVLEAVLAVHARPVLCDVGPDWVVTPANVESRVTPRTRGLILPHMYGMFADIQAFRRFGISIIEDCAQAIDRRGKRTVQGDIAVFSFHPTKCLTTGEGGMAVSRDETVVRAMRLIRDGRDSVAAGRLFSPLSDISAALGLSQLERYDSGVERRRTIADIYERRLVDVVPQALRPAVTDPGMYFRFPLQIDGGVSAYGQQFLERGIVVRRGGVDKLLHRIIGLPDDEFPESVRLFDCTLSLPIYPALADAEVSHCASSARAIFGQGRANGYVSSPRSCESV